jgi:deoxyribodipyrimidine photolyase-related protein
MKQIKTALILYPNQLFSPDLLPQADVIYVVEEPLYFGKDAKRPLKMHKQKLIFHRASMRRYVEEVLWQKDLNVEYIELKDIEFTADVLVRAQQAGAETVMVFDPTDNLIEERLRKALDQTVQTPFELKVLPTPSFMLKRSEIRDYFLSKTKHRFNDFYQWQRERFNILIDENYKPVGGKWSFDAPGKTSGEVPPGFKGFGDNVFVMEAKKWTEEHFADCPGQVQDFFWPTTHDEAIVWLDDFIKNRLDEFVTHKNLIDTRAVLLYHSGLSVMLNSGLLTPKQVVDSLLEHNSKHPINLFSLENIIRRIIGWREYTRGLYVTNNVNQKTLPSQNRPMHIKWWAGTTGLQPFDDLALKLRSHAYGTDNERLMIAANLMLLCEINPADMYKWFASLFIDAYDWVLVPTIYNLAQFNDFAGILSVPYLCDSEKIIESSNYKREIWCDIWDGLFWAFVEKHKAMLAANPMFDDLLKQLDTITPEHRRIIGYRAKDFITSIS